MNRISSYLILGVLVLFECNVAQGQDDPVLSLLKKMPADANSVLVADLAKVRGCDVATKNGWFDSPTGQIESGMGFLAGSTDQVVLATQLDFQTFEPTWTAGLMTMARVPALDYISKNTSGQMDEMDGQKMVQTASDVFVFQAGQQLATFSPANRQLLAQWMSALKDNQNPTPDSYIENAVANRPGNAQLMIACDMNYLVSPAAVMRQAENADALKSAGIDAAQFSKVVASLQGVSVMASFTDSIQGQVRIDFGENAELLKPVAKQLILEVTKNHGVHLDDLSDWNASVNGKQVVLAGDLSTSGLRKLISLFDAPEPHMTSTPPTGSEAPSMAQSTKNYFDSVSSLLKDLKDEIGPGGRSGYQISRFFKSYASKIDNLPLDNVDNDMLNFGSSVAQGLRSMNLKINTAQHSVKETDANIMAYGDGSPAHRYRRSGRSFYGYSYGYGSGGGYGYPWRGGGYGGGTGFGFTARPAGQLAVGNQQVFQEGHAAKVDARADASEYAASVMTDIANGEAEVRRAMAAKYPGVF